MVSFGSLRHSCCGQRCAQHSGELFFHALTGTEAKLHMLRKLFYSRQSFFFSFLLSYLKVMMQRQQGARPPAAELSERVKREEGYD